MARASTGDAANAVCTPAIQASAKNASASAVGLDISKRGCARGSSNIGGF
jgi:hypothetical protein